VNEPDGARRKERLAFAIKSGNENRLRAMIAIAAANPKVAALPADFDAEPDILTVGNGVVDLRTGALRPHRAGDLSTLRAPVPLRPGRLRAGVRRVPAPRPRR
jgi:putative DNA primase/helicase